MMFDWSALNDTTITQWKGVLALAGVVILGWGVLAKRVTRFARGGKVRDALLIIVAALSCSSWFNFGHFHYGPYVHWYELYHYYLGAQYPELGYTRLYDCTIVAEDEWAHLGPQLERLHVRDLVTNELGTGAPALAHPERCKEHFS